MNKYKRLSIKNWAMEDRPREKLLKHGTAYMTDAELIAVLLGSGNTNESAVDLGKKILAAYNNNLQKLGKSGIHELTKFRGIGEAKAICICAALELGKRRNLSKGEISPKITCSQDAYDAISSKISDLPHEEFWILLLNRANHIIDHHKISQGGVSGTVIDVRLVLKNAISNLACGLIIAHNHPSGNLTPSEADRTITGKLKKSAELMDINVLDHLVISGNQYYSFADEGIL
jgi:DNA repair protein RadC